MPSDLDEEFLGLLQPAFWDYYETLCEVLFFGDHRGDAGKISAGRKGSYSFRDDRLFDTKEAVDSNLSTTSAAFVRWRETRARNAGKRRNEAS
jgi:hypothetical protein